MVPVKASALWAVGTGKCRTLGLPPKGMEKVGEAKLMLAGGGYAADCHGEEGHELPLCFGLTAWSPATGRPRGYRTAGKHRQEEAKATRQLVFQSQDHMRSAVKPAEENLFRRSVSSSSVREQPHSCSTLCILPMDM